MARWLQTNVGHAELLACCRRTRALKVVMLGRWNAGPLSSAESGHARALERRPSLALSRSRCDGRSRVC